DICYKQKHLSMKEVGDGLHEQMNCMMGALQELKLLQVQTALEQLEISSNQNQVSGIESETLLGKRYLDNCRSSAFLYTNHGHIASSLSSIGSEDDSGPSSTNKDWTCSLMSQSRNRQPLILGDNIFADLVGNWLDLPEIDRKGEKNEASVPNSKSQEFYRKFSLTANLFKKFLRSVRPDRDRLLREKPCWLPTKNKETEILKRPQTGSKQKGLFYFPIRGSTANSQDKVKRCEKKEGRKAKPKPKPHAKVHTTIEQTRSGFDFNTAVWV
uniref:PAK4-inhibitor INKA2 n=1 Tax=Laticauda laticaudata TaxID=8630 RepID=A0A8C5SNH9_LATLA